MKFLELTALSKEGAILGKLWLHVPKTIPFVITTRDREKGTLLDLAPSGAGATIRVSESPQEIMRQLALLYPDKPETGPILLANGELPSASNSRL